MLKQTVLRNFAGHVTREHLLEPFQTKNPQSSTYRRRENKSCQSCQTVGRMVWVASRVWNPNLLKQFTEANDPVKQMLAGLNKSLEADNRAIINRVVKAEQSINKSEHFKDNRAIIPHHPAKNRKVRHQSFLFGIPDLWVLWPWLKTRSRNAGLINV